MARCHLNRYTDLYHTSSGMLGKARLEVVEAGRWQVPRTCRVGRTTRSPSTYTDEHVACVQPRASYHLLLFVSGVIRSRFAHLDLYVLSCAVAFHTLAGLRLDSTDSVEAPPGSRYASAQLQWRPNAGFLRGLLASRSTNVQIALTPRTWWRSSRHWIPFWRARLSRQSSAAAVNACRAFAVCVF